MVDKSRSLQDLSGFSKNRVYFSVAVWSVQMCHSIRYMVGNVNYFQL